MNPINWPLQILPGTWRLCLYYPCLDSLSPTVTLTLSYQCLSHFVSLMPLTHAVAADVIQLLPLSDSETPWTAAHQASLSFTVSQSLCQLMSIESVLLSNLPILCHPLLLCPQSLPASESFPMSQSVSTSAFYSPFRSYLCLLGSLTLNFRLF